MLLAELATGTRYLGSGVVLQGMEGRGNAGLPRGARAVAAPVSEAGDDGQKSPGHASGIEDTYDWLGCPTPLQTYQRLLRMYENEFKELTLQLCQMRERIYTLVEMNDQLAAEKTKADADFVNATGNLAQMQDERSQLLRQVNSMLLVSDQLDYLQRQNQRLLMEERDRESR
jgi:hypothetical protein